MQNAIPSLSGHDPRPRNRTARGVARFGLLVAVLVGIGWPIAGTARCQEPVILTLGGASHEKEVWAIAFTPDGKTLATGGSRVVRLFDVATRKQRPSIGGLPSEARAIVFSPDGKTLASAGTYNTLQLWDVATGKARSLTVLQPITNISIAFSPDGKTLASTGSDKKLRLWDVATGKESDACVGHDKMVWCVRFSPDGKALASASNDHTVRLWDVATRKERARLEHKNYAISVAFSPDGKLLASGGQDGEVKLWDLTTRKELLEIKAQNWAQTLDFSPDSKTLATGGRANVVKVWDVTTGAERFAFELPRFFSTVHSVKFSPDGKTLAAGIWGEVRLWDVSPSQEKKQPTEAFSNSIGMKLAPIPAGEFMMGAPDSDQDAEDHEKPQHMVRITKPFYLGVHEVTVGEFRKFVEDTGHQTGAETDGKGSSGYNAELRGFEYGKQGYTWKNVGWKQSDDHPVLNVTSGDAMAFCLWLSKKESKTYRLPTEAEWEYACRGGTTTRFFSGDALEDTEKTANVLDQSLIEKWEAAARDLRLGKPHKYNVPVKWNDGYPFTAPVGRFKPNAFGLYDMHGNAAEWCADWYEKDYYQSSPANDPTGPVKSTTRVVRGGTFLSSPKVSRSSARVASFPDYHNYVIGFRVVLEKGAVSAGKKTPTNKEKTIGTWKAAIADKKERVEFGVFTFRDDGKFTLERDHFLDLAKGTYAVDGDTFKITVTHAVDGAPLDKGPWPVKVKSFSEKEIVLELKGDDTTVLVHFARVPVPEGAWKAVDEDSKRIQGSWEHVRSEVNGKEVKDNEMSGTMTFEGEKVLVKGSKEYGIFTLNANKKLKAIQFRWSNGKGLANLGAYELNGDTLRLCRDTDRGFPEEFKTMGTKNRIDEFKRVKK